MIEEKISAVCEGAFGAAMAWNQLFLDAAFGGLNSPQKMSNALVDVADAALAPARRTVRANAKRLTSRGLTH